MLFYFFAYRYLRPPVMTQEFSEIIFNSFLAKKKTSLYQDQL